MSRFTLLVLQIRKLLLLPGSEALAVWKSKQSATDLKSVTLTTDLKSVTVTLALQGNVVQGRACKSSQDLHTLQFHRGWQSEILKFHALALSKISTYLLRVIAPKECMMHNLQKIFQVVFKRIKRIWQISCQPLENFEFIAS